MLHEITKKNQWTTKFPTIYLQGRLIGGAQGYPWVGWFIGWTGKEKIYKKM